MEKKRSLICWFILQMTAEARNGPDQSKDSGTPFVSATWVAEDQVIGPSSVAFLGTLLGTWIGSRGARSLPVP